MSESLLAFLDGIGDTYGNVSMAILMTAGALLTYVRLGFDQSEFRLPMGRSLIAVGLTMWSIRFWWALSYGVDATVPPISQIAVSIMLFGYCLVQIRTLIKLALDAGLPNVHCIRDPEYPCSRRDRRVAALLGTLKIDKS